MVAALGLALGAALMPPAATSATAASAGDFTPGNIISDARFFDANAMSQAQVQTFLEQMMPNCRATDPNLPCLRNFVGTTNTKPSSGAGHCTGYNSEGWESAARIIWRVGQACGINPQVLLVTLQKEQTLITSTAPSERQYRVAMGYACPDTGACDTQYYGFFNQVYSAAWQFRQYTNFPDRRYKIGSTSIQYNPSVSCGSSTVYIQNQATANLYNYTPYQPNQAALANLYGSGDGCSAYGNRNFWVTFSDWFGSPTAAGAAQINAQYLYQGGPTGPLGPPVGGLISIPQNGGGSAQVYQNASIYWTPRTGAWYVWKEIRTYYWQANGSAGRLGWPTSNPVAVAAASAGQGQVFENGSIYQWSGGAFSVEGAFRSKYWAVGGPGGSLGWPLADRVATSGGFAQRYQNADVYSTGAAGTWLVSGAILNWYGSSGGPTGAAGWPASDTVRVVENGGGLGQAFAGGSVYSSAAGTFLVSGSVRNAYWSRNGSAGALGWPTGAQSCSGGVCSQAFQYGTLVVDANGTARVTWPAIESFFASQGGATGVLGVALSEAIRIPENGGGFGQAFAGGSVYSSAAGTFLVSGSVRNAYWSRNGSAGRRSRAVRCTRRRPGRSW
ncbi:hypothetical protein ASD23_10090 [Agromyces sp. Root1464]|nr:hypothetical protein ASD23_10090 [Agromyces sp. Root1464]